MMKPEQISALYFEALGSQHLREQDRKMVTRFAHAVEYEVRKSDDALIGQLVEALEYHRAQTRPIELTDEAITAARARLEGKP